MVSNYHPVRQEKVSSYMYSSLKPRLRRRVGIVLPGTVHMRTCDNHDEIQGIICHTLNDHIQDAFQGEYAECPYFQQIHGLAGFSR